MMAKDPVCHMNVDESKATLKAENGGVMYYFCAQVCKDRFLADPGKYIGGGAAGSHHRS
jgi:Cu+-exporting ATPase